MKVSRIILILASIAIIVAFFLPYFSSTEETKEAAEVAESIKPLDSVDITAKDLIDPSLFTYAKVYFQGREELYRNPSEGIFQAAIYCMIPLFGLLVLIFALTKKAIPAMIFSILAAVMAYLIRYDFESRRVIPNPMFQDGIAYYLCYACAAVMFISSLCLLITKSKAKKSA